MKYERINVEVSVVFTENGEMLPKAFRMFEENVPIRRVVRKRVFCPPDVGCICPTEYTVRTENTVLHLYYEEETGIWFVIRSEEGVFR